MIYASGLPYAPHMYEIVTNNVTLINSTDRLAQLDMSRVGLYIQLIGAAFPAGAYFTANSTGTNAARLTNTSTLGLTLYWYQYYTLTGSEIWINDAGIGNVFNVIEVRLNRDLLRSTEDAARKPIPLRDKIKNYLLLRRS